MTIETIEYPYSKDSNYEQVDLDGEPQYESLEDYDKLPSNSGADKIPQPKHADCTYPVYEPTIIGIS